MIELNQLIDSKIYVKSNISFMQPKELVYPWLESIGYSGEPIRILSQNEVVNENEDGKANIAYPRFLVEVSKGVHTSYPSESSVHGLLVAMDTAPVIKIYSGMNAHACTNLSIFNAEHIHQQSLLTDLKNVWQHSKKFFDDENAKLLLSSEAHSFMANTLNNDQVNRLLGDMLRKAHYNKFGTTPIVSAARRLGDKSSAYYFNPKEVTTYENVYQAITQSITESKELLNKPEKTLLAYDMIRNN